MAPLVLAAVHSTRLRPRLQDISTTHNVLIHCKHEVTLSPGGPGSDLLAAQSDMRALIESVERSMTTEPLVLHCCNIPLLITAPIISGIDAIKEEFGVDIHVVTTSGDFVTFSDFVANISGLRSGGESDSLLLVSEVSRFAEMRLDHNWRYEGDDGQMKSFPAPISRRLNENFHPFRNRIVPFLFHSIQCRVDFSQMKVVQEGSDKCGKIDNEPPVWWYSDTPTSSVGAGSPKFSCAFDSVTSQEIDLAVHYGAPGLLNLGDSQLSFDVLASPVVLHDFTRGLKLYLHRYPPLPDSRDRLVTLAVSCRSDDWPQIELSLNTLLHNYMATQMYPIPNTPAPLQCLLVNIARQFCVKLTAVENSDSQACMLKLEGEREYVLAVKLHLLEVFQQKIASLAMERPLAIPHHWKQGQRSPVETVIVPVGTEEWNEVEGLIRQSLPRVRLIEITRIQNLMLWQRYSFFKSLMSRRNNQVNERLLFHGTRATDPKKIITSEKGFDFRYSSENGLWGKGLYFAVKASYSDAQFAFHTPQGTKQVFVGRVLTGRSVYIPRPNRELKEPPKLPHSATESYDSVNGVVQNPVHSEVFVIYDHDKTYPAYLITYS